MAIDKLKQKDLDTQILNMLFFILPVFFFGNYQSDFSVNDVRNWNYNPIYKTCALLKHVDLLSSYLNIALAKLSLSRFHLRKEKENADAYSYEKKQDHNASKSPKEG